MRSRSSRASRCRSRRSTTTRCWPDIVGRVEDDRAGRRTRCSRCASRSLPRRVGTDAGQLLNMLFGNTSLHEDVVLRRCRAAGGAVRRLRRSAPRHRTACAGGPVRSSRALTCTALKPQGLSAGAARRAGRPLRPRRHRLRQGRPRPRRPGLLRRSPRGWRRSSPPLRRVSESTGQIDTLRAEPVGRSRRHASPDRPRPRRRHRHRDDRADDRRPVEPAPAGARQSRTSPSSRTRRWRARRASPRRC